MKNIHFLTASSMLLIYSACGTDIPSMSHPEEDHIGTPRPLQGVQAQCQNTGGQWHPQLISCTCPAHSVFFLEDGCRYISPKLISQIGCPEKLLPNPSQDLQECLSKALKYVSQNLKIILDGLSISDLQFLADTASEDLTRLLQGMTLSRNPASPIHIRLSHFSGSHARRAWNSWLSGEHSKPLFSEFDPISLRKVFQKDGFLQDCHRELQNHGHPNNALVYSQLCDTAGNFIKDIIEQSGYSMTTSQTDANFTQEGENCTPECALVLNPRNSAAPAIYHTTMRGFLPEVRYITVSADNAVELFVFLSPLGQVQGIAMQESILASSDAPHMLENHTLIWQYNWNLTASYVSSEGDRASILHALKDLKPPQNLLPTDAGRTLIKTPIHALIIDTGIDIRVPELRSRLKLSASAAAKSLQDGNRIDSLFSHSHGWVDHVHEILSSHGTEMTALITAGLPYASVDLLHSDDAVIQAEQQHVPEQWITKIHQNQPRVVNISVGYSRYVANCEGFIGKVFEACPEVLFVVAMGNSGGRNPSGTCPAGIAYKYPHVITVAGADESGKHIDRYSNYGSKVAMVAAPMNAQTLDVEESVRAGYPKLMETGGTSISAAWVSNAALRLLTQYDSLRPSDVIKILMQACKKDGLDVACGGEIDFKKIEASLIFQPQT